MRCDAATHGEVFGKVKRAKADRDDRRDCSVSREDQPGKPSQVYIGGLGNAGDEEEIEKAFRPFGLIRTLFVARRPPGFAFVEYERFKDARVALEAMTGKLLCGREVRIELSHGRSRWPGGRPPPHLLRMPAPRRVRSPPPGGPKTAANGDGDQYAEDYFQQRAIPRRPRRRRRSRSSSCSSTSTTSSSSSSSTAALDRSGKNGTKKKRKASRRGRSSRRSARRAGSKRSTHKKRRHSSSSGRGRSSPGDSSATSSAYHSHHSNRPNEHEPELEPDAQQDAGLESGLVNGHGATAHASEETKQMTTEANKWRPIYSPHDDPTDSKETNSPPKSAAPRTLSTGGVNGRCDAEHEQDELLDENDMDLVGDEEQLENKTPPRPPPRFKDCGTSP